MTKQTIDTALRDLLLYAESRSCEHNETHRGGAIWTVCDECGSKWADDEGGFPGYKEPKEFAQARAALSAQPATTPLSDAQIEKLREKTFSTDNPFCPVDRKSMRKAARAIEVAHGITAPTVKGADHG